MSLVPPIRSVAYYRTLAGFRLLGLLPRVREAVPAGRLRLYAVAGLFRLILLVLPTPVAVQLLETFAEHPEES